MPLIKSRIPNCNARLRVHMNANPKQLGGKQIDHDGRAMTFQLQRRTLFVLDLVDAYMG